ncbi:EAL domain-containing protein [Marinomonas mediterranea]|uniref:cyclic-guanylate-specific phosphodiesterase n=1 Tax=Marinomonas mediterranea (strain ATCC 700492 / JCM 21426 / NBRC 103028 / MMB-1) TaxID=717774 RepID=F2K0H9_MARM1|nr:EAL domain-containing protein [Marinomonas mediterranea]ADZ90963.1 EAL domain protein [Marinomonas mediterranea MMB-1]WCN17107.1 EAL domain-containing protein [Marinomonas mediterranea MMB-1]
MLGYLSFLVFFVCFAFIVVHFAIIRYDFPELEKHSELNFEKLERLAFQVKRGAKKLQDSGATPCTRSELFVKSDILKQYYFIGDIGRVSEGKLNCSLMTGRQRGLEVPDVLTNGTDQIRVKTFDAERNKVLYSNFAFVKNDLVFFTSKSFIRDLSSQNTLKNSIGSIIHSREGAVYLYFGDVDRRSFTDEIDHQNALSDYLPVRGKKLAISRCSVYVDVCLTSIDTDLGIFRASETFVLSFGSFSALFGSLLFYFFVLLRSGARGLASDIKWAIKREKIYNVYQPLFHLDNEALSGVEVLARWESRRCGQVPPDIFIPFCETQEYILDLTKVVVSKAFMELEDRLTSDTNFTVSINVSASVLTDKRFLEFLMLEVKKYEFGYDQVILELTERSSTPERSLIQSCASFHELGVKLSLDDFGTGHSNLSWLTLLNPNEVKIDKMFTQANGDQSPKGFAFEGIVSMLSGMQSARVVYEGIETEEQRARLLGKLPNALGQGWYFAKPMPISEYRLWVSNREFENKC